MPEQVNGTARNDPLLSLDDAAVGSIRRRAVRMLRDRPGVLGASLLGDAEPEPGQFVVETTTAIFEPDGWHRGVGVLVEKRGTGWDETWYVQYGPGPDDICEWQNCAFAIIPPEILAQCNAAPGDE